MPYLNDVFISYKRGTLNEQWLNDIFLPLFTAYLDSELPDPPRIFVDKTGLTPGVAFDKELFQNLFYSKCLVSIWSKPYFRRSEWCVKELLTMRYRQEFWRLDQRVPPTSLIWPILYRPVNPLPQIAAPLTYKDYTDFFLVGDAFFKTEKYIQFQEKLQVDVAILGQLISRVPDLNVEWETVEGKNGFLANLNTYLNNNWGLDGTTTQGPISW